MRILLPNHFPLEGSGSGIYTQNVARELVHKGHAALAITPAHDEQTGFPFDVRSILFTPADAAAENSDRLPFNFPCFTTHPLSSVTYGDLDTSQRTAYVHAFQTAIKDAVAAWKPDLIHAQHLWVAPYVAARTSIPTVVTAHGTDLMGYRKYEAWKGMAREGAHKAQAVIAISKQVAADTKALYGIAAEGIHIIMNGFDQSIFHVMPVDRDAVLEQHGIAESAPKVISFVGKLTRFKGVDLLLQAAALYEPALDGVLTLIVGDGELRQPLQSQAQALNLRGVHFLGHQPQQTVARILNVADLSIVPSRIEPFGLVAVEALACGTPVVATNEGGLPDFVNPDVGALVPVDDPQALAEAILSEIRQDAKARKGAHAAAYALQDFSWSGQVDKMIALYEQVG